MWLFVFKCTTNAQAGVSVFIWSRFNFFSEVVYFPCDDSLFVIQSLSNFVFY